MSFSEISTESELRKIIGQVPSSIKIKIIKSLEKNSTTFLENYNYLVLGSFGFTSNALVFGKSVAKVEVIDTATLKIHYPIDSTEPLANENIPCSIFVLVGNIEESLRLNGYITQSTSELNGYTSVIFSMDELYLHCAKSVKRSQFWQPRETSINHNEGITQINHTEPVVKSYLEQTPFLLLLTQDAEGNTDLSPRGDPQGFVKYLDNDTLLLPERPGNRLADSLTNVIHNSTMAVLCVIPGTSLFLTIKGEAKLTHSKSLLAECSVQNKAPKVGFVLTIKETYFGFSEMINVTKIWDKSEHPDRSILPSFGTMITEQIQSAGKLPKEKSFLGKMVGKVTSSATDAVIKSDYKKLY